MNGATPKANTRAAWNERASELADWATARFFVRTDRYGGYFIDRETGETRKSARPNAGCETPFSRDIVLRHFRASKTDDVIGHYFLTPGQSSGRVTSADIDAHDANDDPDRNRHYGEHLYFNLAALGFRPLLATWGGGSFHLHVLFNRDLPGADLRAFGQWVVSDAGAFGFSDPVESFPKQALVPEGKFGNWLRLIGRHHTRDTWASVFDGTNWLDGPAAVGHVLSLSGDPSDLIPLAARPTVEDAPAAEPPASKKGRAPRAGSSHGRADVFAAYNRTIALDTVVGWHERQGHKVARRGGERVEFVRDGKSAGESFNVALVGGVPITFNFSTRAGLPARQGLSPSQVRCLYETGACDEAALNRFAAVLRAEMGWTAPSSTWTRASTQSAANPSANSAPIFDDTDVANGRRFASDHGGKVHFVADWEQWVVYDGRRWEVDRSETRVEQLAKATVDRMAVEAAERVGAIARAIAQASGDELDRLKEEDKKARAALSHAKKSADMRAIGRMLHAARSESGICVAKGGKVFDTRRDLLNCPNGTVELRTGTLREHRREDHITRLCPIRFDSSARRDRYLAFLDVVFDGHPKVAKYVREFSGCAVTGEVSDQTLHIFNGGGSNGKGVLIETWTAVLGEGEYVHTAAPELLLSDGRGDRHPTEKTGLRGVHLVVCSETDEDRHLDEAKMKVLTGGDTVTARYMRGDFFQFEPTHKLVLLTNNRPCVKGTDHGVWRRLRLVPFLVKFWKDADREIEPNAKYADRFKADTLLGKFLRATEAEGVLADMVEQAVAFYRGKGTLNPPAEVVKATAEYRDSEDTIGQFFAAKVRADDDGRVKGADFYKAFVAWWETEGNDPKRAPSATKFGREAKRKFNHSRPSGFIYHVHISPSWASPPPEGSEGWRQNAHKRSPAGAGSESEPENASNPPNPPEADPDWSQEEMSFGEPY
ncbi:Phage/plasmid primase, P4 family OS=Desulfotomaculum acetoxidans (strain ATCC 49208 / DSM 771 / VKM B-1644) GN=Dtox_3701 PE=4 SV=1: D5_N [Gemmata massiliana]|uniref:SF3 helicase domain-containing protein n=1 Tax=Gemmata massiliana TaxID=1210884 RepID=A0A6P2CYT9_9BACT|nr:phage/plasmid primase, P4 family [Gemmata massiliana]VTR94059.1 Phage/plasmid primase, P4 family OS=Desulfotomaculum acetoxidans (strain ATCC 49208 / DSM 771 / VKM B-1644) GN=Dtox_3701 PE=4 SV=1: D5_N [Gemmata massiliana]